MPMQVVFPTVMVAVGVIGAGALTAVANAMRFRKVRYHQTNITIVDSQTCHDRSFRRCHDGA